MSHMERKPQAKIGKINSHQPFIQVLHIKHFMTRVWLAKEVQENLLLSFTGHTDLSLKHIKDRLNGTMGPWINGMDMRGLMYPRLVIMHYQNMRTMGPNVIRAMMAQPRKIILTTQYNLVCWINT